MHFTLKRLNTTGTRDLFTIQADGSGLRNLTRHPADDVGGDWSPDGRSIVFQSNRTGKFAIYRMDADGGNVAKITLGADKINPSYSPDGSRVIFLSVRNGAFEIWTVDPGGFEERRVTPTEISDRTPRWKPQR